jgi:hypothetical protein
MATASAIEEQTPQIKLLLLTGSSSFPQPARPRPASTWLQLKDRSQTTILFIEAPRPRPTTRKEVVCKTYNPKSGRFQLMTTTQLTPTPDVHPWTREPGYESISVLTETEAERDQQVKALKLRGFEAWIVGHIVGTNQPAAYVFRKIRQA